MRFLKYLVFIFLSSISLDLIADVYILGDAGFRAPNAEQLCSSYGAKQSVNNWKYTVVSSDNNKCVYKRSWNDGPPNDYSVGWAGTEDCPSNITTKPISVPGWTDWDIDQIEDYHKKISPTICYKGCRFKDPSMNGSEGSDLLSLSYSSPQKDASCPADSTQPNTPSPDGPSNPTDPTNPPPDEQECKNENGSDAYCPKPPNGCPTGYSEQSFNGEQICVKNSPDDPNPNDPNNNDNQPPASEPTGGDGNGVDLTPVINAINSLKAALTSAINSLKESLTAGFKTVTDAIGVTNSKLDATNTKLDATNTKLDKSNDHLDNIQKESVKTNSKLDSVNQNITTTNSKLDTANEYLKNINDNSKAASEAIGQTNKKLDGIKDAVEGAYGCANENYNPNDKNSNKYRECTEADLNDGGSAQDGKVDVIQREIETNFDGNIISVNDQCPPPLVIRFTLLQSHEISFDYDNFCYGASLARPWVIFIGMLIAFLIVTGQYRGGSDA